jgi:hypothetical protein
MVSSPPRLHRDPETLYLLDLGQPPNMQVSKQGGPYEVEISRVLPRDFPSELHTTHSTLVDWSAHWSGGATAAIPRTHLGRLWITRHALLCHVLPFVLSTVQFKNDTLADREQTSTPSNLLAKHVITT